MATLAVYRNMQSCPDHVTHTDFVDGRWVTRIIENGEVVVEVESDESDLISRIEADDVYLKLYKSRKQAA